MKKKKIILIVVVTALMLLAALLLLEKSGWQDGLKIGKNPDRYTWEEYQELSREDRDVFFEWFGSVEAFEAWMGEARPDETASVIREWDQPENLPNTYTWEEYQALSSEEQEAFYQWFGSIEVFETWKNAVQPEETLPVSFVIAPDKDPEDYTWEEYQAMSAKEQDEFFQYFDSVDAFEAWLEAIKSEETLTWDRPGKQPDEYTWEEYQELSPEEQDAFFLWFTSVRSFETWMETVKPRETTASVVDWQNADKKPDEYTWEEYQELSPEEQDAFFLWFGSVEAFEAWMSEAIGA